MYKKNSRIITNQPGGGESQVSDKRLLSVKGILLAALAVAGLSVYAGCGKVGSSDIPTPAITKSAIVSFEAIGPRGDTSDGSGKMSVRAQSRDLLEVIATVTGLNRTVGFFIPEDWGTWQGGTLNDDDSFTYYPVDGSGTAKGTLVAGSNAGRHDVIARYQDFGAGDYVEARLSITFNLATMSIFPSTIVLNSDPSKGKVVEVRGALPPVEWWVSHPDVMGFHIRDETSIILFWIDAQKPIGSTSLPAGGGTLTVLDAEGQQATAIVYMINTGCTAGVLTLSPSTGPTTTAITVTVEDQDRALDGGTTVTVFVSGAQTSATSVVLNQTGGTSSSLYSAVYTYTSGTTGAVTFTYQDPDEPSNNCISGSITATFTGT
ncbi:hypothetical protein MNBD_NITROSPINAE04-1165 [hydrothermal vent metagenome]|uniref:Uncharacterized protein n=1 Tax=hydrothermal vent metagenome TaxID=652676 RepID=A0A3B1BTD0_9ZZZZ